LSKLSKGQLENKKFQNHGWKFTKNLWVWRAVYDVLIVKESDPSFYATYRRLF